MKRKDAWSPRQCLQHREHDFEYSTFIFIVRYKKFLHFAMQTVSRLSYTLGQNVYSDFCFIFTKDNLCSPDQVPA